jgi:hypothetical protein
MGHGYADIGIADRRGIEESAAESGPMAAMKFMVSARLRLP